MIYMPAGYAGPARTIIVLLDILIVMFLAGLWVVRKIESRFVLHGVLVGIAANLVTLPLMIPLLVLIWSEEAAKAASNPDPAMARDLLYAGLKILGSVPGAYICGRRRRKLLTV
jgi:hypothetical protein